MSEAVDDVALSRLYADFDAADLLPLWTQRAGLMPTVPTPSALPHCWRWDDVYPLAVRAGALVPVGRGGERRAIAYGNPGLPGLPHATPTLWAALQYLGPAEVAPAHRHSQTAFRFILHGQGVWTLVDGDPVEMRRGDLLLTAAWAWHEHHNTGDTPMVWLDGLDIPLVSTLDAGFFEFGPEEISDRSTPTTSRSERLWAHPGLRPLGVPVNSVSPLGAYRWEHTDAALREQLALEAEGHPATVDPGHAAVRFVNPVDGTDALTTSRWADHRRGAGAATTRRQEVGSSVWQVFTGEGTVELGDQRLDVTEGDVVAVPSWCPHTWSSSTGVDLFRFSDAPVIAALGLDRQT